MNSELTLDAELLPDLPILEVFKNGKLEYYKTDAITKGEIIFVNLDNEEDEWYVSIRNLLPENDMGIILNFDDYFLDLKEVSVSQEVIDYQTNKRISDY